MAIKIPRYRRRVREIYKKYEGVSIALKEFEHPGYDHNEIEVEILEKDAFGERFYKDIYLLTWDELKKLHVHIEWREGVKLYTIPIASMRIMDE